MPGNTYLDLVAGVETVQNGTQVSAGSADAGKIVALNSNGQIDSSMLNGQVDGGSAVAVYTLPQIINGGNA